jgi:beta-glucosidase
VVAVGLSGYALIAAGPAAHAAPVLLSQGKTATASTVEDAGTPPSAAVDGNTISR